MSAAAPPAGPESGHADFRFYEELNDFLPPWRRRTRFTHDFRGPASVKDMIEALGVPHTEVDLILVNGQSVDFRYRVRDGDDISVYPVFESLDIAPLAHLRPRPLRVIRFVLDVHLGRLARHLRLLGFDTLYRNDYDDAELARISREQRRILLTRDVGLLKRSEVTHGCYLRQTDPARQLEEVVRRLDLVRAARPFARCLACNGRLVTVRRSALAGQLKPPLLAAHRRFRRCPDCGRIYWPGSHWQRLQQRVGNILQQENPPA